MPLQPVTRESVADAVYGQLLDGVLTGELDAGEELPGERALTSALGVNRQAVREALQRLAAAGLVEIRHGGRTRVRDFRRTAGLDLLPRLLISPDGNVDSEVANGLMELRTCLGTDAARMCAERAPGDVRKRIAALANDMVEAREDRSAVAALDLAFWEAVVDGAGNIAYRLAFNGMRQTYEPVAELLLDVLADEFADAAARGVIVAAITAGDGPAAAAGAQRLLNRGQSAVRELLETLDAERSRT